MGLFDDFQQAATAGSAAWNSPEQVGQMQKVQQTNEFNKIANQGDPDAMLKWMETHDPDTAAGIKLKQQQVAESVSRQAGQDTENQVKSQVYLANVYSQIQQARQMAVEQGASEEQADKYADKLYGKLYPQVIQHDADAPPHYDPERAWATMGQAITAKDRWEAQQKQQNQDAPEIQKQLTYAAQLEAQGQSDLAKRVRDKVLSQGGGANATINMGDQTYKVPDGYVLKDPQNPQAGVTPLPGGPRDEVASGDSGKTQLLRLGKEAIGDYQKYAITDGKYDASKMAAVFYNIPGSDGATVRAKMNPGLEAALRLETGAAVQADELERVKNRFIPAPWDNKETADAKLKLYEKYMTGAISLVDPSKRFDESRFDNELEKIKSGESVSPEQAQKTAAGLSPETQERYKKASDQDIADSLQRYRDAGYSEEQINAARTKLIQLRNAGPQSNAADSTPLALEGQKKIPGNILADSSTSDAGGGALASAVKAAMSPQSQEATQRAVQAAQSDKPTPFSVASSYLGKNEVKDKAALTSFFKKSLGKSIDPAQVPWCANFVNAVLATSGQKGTGSLAARSFLKWGEETKKPTKGDIAVFSRGNNPSQGHVGFFAGMEEIDGRKYVKVLGGNQGDSVSVKLMPYGRLLGFRKAPTVEEIKAGIPESKEIFNSGRFAPETKMQTKLELPAGSQEEMPIADDIKTLAPQADPTLVKTISDNQNVLEEYGINTPERKQQFFAQLAHETGGFKYTEELPSKYASSSSTYKGRGLIQLTGKSNYKYYGDMIGEDLVKHPDKAADPVTSLKIAAAFWKDNGLNKLADKGDIKAITRRLNGKKMLGLSERIKYLQKAKNLFNDSNTGTSI